MRKMSRSLAPALAIFVAGAGTSYAEKSDGPITYGCEEVVVIGRVKTNDYTELTGPQDMLGHGRYDMTVNIKRVLRGKETRRAVPAASFAHSEMREDVDFWLILTPSTHDGYVIRTGDLTGFPYKLAARCQ